ncbi:hypothetical protein QFZ94_008124 [Paraburkholderia sp. JPY465]
MDEFGMKPLPVGRRQVVLEDIERGARELVRRKRAPRAASRWPAPLSALS